MQPTCQLQSEAYSSGTQVSQHSIPLSPTYTDTRLSHLVHDMKLTCMTGLDMIGSGHQCVAFSVKLFEQRREEE